jgi:hypothetical protein
VSYSRPTRAPYWQIYQVIARFNLYFLECLEPVHDAAEKLSEENFDSMLGDCNARNLADDVGVNLQEKVAKGMEEECCHHNE